MFIIHEIATGKIVCWAEEGQDALYPSAAASLGQIESRLDCTVEEFEDACRESSGDRTSEGVGPNYLHDTVEEATKSTKTSKKGVKIGHKAVECEHPDNIPAPSPLADIIREKKKNKNDNTLTLDELAEAEKELSRRAL